MAFLPDSDPSGWTLRAQVPGIINNATTMALDIAGIVAAIFIVIGGFQYFMAYGDESKAETGKKTLLWAIIGLAVVISARLLVGSAWLVITGGPLT